MDSESFGSFLKGRGISADKIEENLANLPFFVKVAEGGMVLPRHLDHLVRLLQAKNAPQKVIESIQRTGFLIMEYQRFKNAQAAPKPSLGLPGGIFTSSSDRPTGRSLGKVVLVSLAVIGILGGGSLFYYKNILNKGGTKPCPSDKGTDPSVAVFENVDKLPANIRDHYRKSADGGKSEKSEDGGDKERFTLEKLPGDVAIAYENARKAIWNSDFVLGETDLKKAVELKDDFTEGWYNLGATQTRLAIRAAKEGREGEAIAKFHDAVNSKRRAKELIDQGKWFVYDPPEQEQVKYDIERALEDADEVMQDDRSLLAALRMYSD